MIKLLKWKNIIKTVDGITLVVLAYYVIFSIVRVTQLHEMSFCGDKLFAICTNYFFWIGFIKLFVYFDYERKKSLIAFCIILLVFLCRYLGLCDYTGYLAPILALNNVSFRRVAETFGLASGITILVVVICSLTGIICDNVGPVNTARFIQERHTLGFANYNFALGMYLYCGMALVWRFNSKIGRIVISVVIIIGTAILWFLTGSLTSGGISFVVCICAICDVLLNETIFSKVYNNLKKAFLGIMLFLPFFVIVYTVLFTYMSVDMINNEYLLSFADRFYYIYQALERVGVSMPYSTIDATNSNMYYGFNAITGLGSNSYVEAGQPHNVYFDIFLEDGLMILVPYIMLQLCVLVRLYKQQKYCLMFICCASIVYGSLELLPIQYAASGVFSWLLLSPEMNTVRLNNSRHMKIT